MMFSLRRRKPRLWLVTPARPNRDFFEKVVDEFATVAEENDYDLVLKAPRGEYETAPSVLVVNALTAELNYRDVLVLIPAVDNAQYPPLERYLRGARACTVITFDLPMRIADRPLPYARGSDQAGGRLAADAADWHLRQLEISRPARVLLVRGLWAQTRVEVFKSALRENRKNLIFLELAKPCRWDLEGACAAVHSYIEAHSKDEIDIIFCSNDEMALGARLAIIDARRKGLEAASSTRVIGFDGTDTFSYLLRCRDSILLNSVDVGVRAQVKKAMDIIRLLNKNSDPEEDETYIEVAPQGLLIPKDAQSF